MKGKEKTRERNEKSRTSVFLTLPPLLSPRSPLRLEVLLAAAARVLTRFAGIVEVGFNVPSIVDGGGGDGRLEVGRMRIGGLPHLVTSCSTSEVVSSCNKLVPGVEEEVEFCLRSTVQEGFRTAVKVVGGAVTDEADALPSAEQLFFFLLFSAVGLVGERC